MTRRRPLGDIVKVFSAVFCSAMEDWSAVSAQLAISLTGCFVSSNVAVLFRFECPVSKGLLQHPLLSQSIPLCLDRCLAATQKNGRNSTTIQKQEEKDGSNHRRGPSTL